jgi:hypothetical protein
MGIVWLLALGGRALPQGLLPEDPAVLAALPHAPAYRAWLPSAVDLSADFPPPGDQGQLGSCTGWAVGYALRSYIERETKGTDISQRGNRFNPLFLYNRVAQSCSSGARVTDALAFMVRFGALPFREMSSMDCPDGAGPDAIERAGAYRIGPFRLVPPQRSDDLKGEIAHRRPLVFGIRDTTALHHLGPDDVYAQPSSRELGKHAMVIVGYDDARQAFKVMNSWGRGWGDGGFGWIAYATFAEEAEFAVSADPAPTPTPAPTPPPIVRPPPAPDPVAGLRARMRALSATLACTRLDVSPIGKVSGFVGAEADLGKVRGAAEGAPTDGVAVRPWPQCEALLTLDKPMAGADGLLVTLDAPGRRCPSGTLCGGDALVATVRMPRRSSYLYLAYIQAAGDTLILEQPASEAPTPRKPGEVVVLGRGDSQPDMRIAAPFGREMVIALASASPLFDKKLPDQMTEREFLTVLRKALIYKPRPSDPDRLVAAAVLPISTSAR